jgi:hypothetical protein
MMAAIDWCWRMPRRVLLDFVIWCEEEALLGQMISQDSHWISLNTLAIEQHPVSSSVKFRGDL